MQTALKLIQFETTEQKEKIAEFLESKCDLFSSSDFYYYAEVTGKGIDWIRENAKYNEDNGILGTCLENAIIDGDYDLAGMLF